MNTPKDKLIFDGPWDVADYVNRAIAHAEAHADTSTRLNEAHEYVQKYCMPEGWGRNVWHTILDDAIRMRRELANSQTLTSP